MRTPLRSLIAALALVAGANGCALERGIMPVEEMRLIVAPAMVECQGLWGPMTCLQVKDAPDGAWRHWHAPIEGFSWEEGYDHEIIVEVFRLTGEIPMDSSDRVYRLKRLVSKLPAGNVLAEPSGG